MSASKNKKPMQPKTLKALKESEEQVRLFLAWIRETSQRIEDVLDRKIPVTNIIGPRREDQPSQRPFSEDEQDYLDAEGFKDLIRVAVAARVAYREAVMIRRHGK